MHGPLRSFGTASSFSFNLQHQQDNADKSAVDAGSADFLDSILNGSFVRQKKPLEDFAVQPNRIRVPQQAGSSSSTRSTDITHSTHIESEDTLLEKAKTLSLTAESFARRCWRRNNCGPPIRPATMLALEASDAPPATKQHNSSNLSSHNWVENKTQPAMLKFHQEQCSCPWSCKPGTCPCVSASASDGKQLHSTEDRKAAIEEARLTANELHHEVYHATLANMQHRQQVREEVQDTKEDVYDATLISLRNNLSKERERDENRMNISTLGDEVVKEANSTASRSVFGEIQTNSAFQTEL